MRKPRYSVPALLWAAVFFILNALVQAPHDGSGAEKEEQQKSALEAKVTNQALDRERKALKKRFEAERRSFQADCNSREREIGSRSKDIAKLPSDEQKKLRANLEAEKKALQERCRREQAAITREYKAEERALRVRFR